VIADRAKAQIFLQEGWTGFWGDLPSGGFVAFFFSVTAQQFVFGRLVGRKFCADADGCAGSRTESITTAGVYGFQDSRGACHRPRPILPRQMLGGFRNDKVESPGRRAIPTDVALSQPRGGGVFDSARSGIGWISGNALNAPFIVGRPLAERGVSSTQPVITLYHWRLWTTGRISIGRRNNSCYGHCRIRRGFRRCFSQGFRAWC